MSDAQPHPTADQTHEDRDPDEIPAGADPRRQYTDPEFDEDDEPPPPNPAERGDIT
jgi:hypothetical protein